MKTQHVVLIGLLIGASLVVFSCADLKNDLPAPVSPGVSVHAPDWVDTASANFHGKAVQAANGDVSLCLNCHGMNYQGGSSGVSCVACHQSRGASIHGRGWVDPASPNFHGNTIRAAGWDMRSCQTCHGVLYDGGKVGVSCRACHTGTGGPEGCSTCHGSTNPAPPRDLDGNTSTTARGVGAHQIHVTGSPRSGSMFCGQCHTTPGDIYAPGHFDPTPGAEVLFNSPLANTVTNEPTTIDYDPTLPLYTPSPAYNASTLKCSNVYCHGYFKNGNLAFAPTWNDTTGASGSSCGTCHGDVTQPLNTVARVIPKTTLQGGSHPVMLAGATCATCHGDVVDANYRIINPLKHVNGKLSMIDLSGNFVERDF